jgi:hypothetical protein
MTRLVFLPSPLKFTRFAIRSESSLGIRVVQGAPGTVRWSAHIRRTPHTSLHFLVWTSWEHVSHAGQQFRSHLHIRAMPDPPLLISPLTPNEWKAANCKHNRIRDERYVHKVRRGQFKTIIMSCPYSSQPISISRPLCIHVFGVQWYTCREDIQCVIGIAHRSGANHQLPAVNVRPLDPTVMLKSLHFWYTIYRVLSTTSSRHLTGGDRKYRTLFIFFFHFFHFFLLVRRCHRQKWQFL